MYYAIRQLLKTQSFIDKVGDKKLGIAGKTFSVQGFGNVGYWVSKFLERDGGKVTHIIEYNSAISNEDGFDVEDVKAYLTENGTLEGYPHAQETEVDDPMSFMERPCDYLIPAATEKSIHKVNAPKLQTMALFEGANGPTTFAAEELLEERGIIVCPDLLVNGGGVTCSYFEWLKNISHVSPGKMTKKFDQQSQMKLMELIGISPEGLDIKGADEIDIVYTALDEIMTEATKDNWDYAIHHNLNFRDACLGNAIMKIYKMYQDSGLTL